MSDTLIGIDLGTSNCAVAYIDLAHGPDAPVLDFEITQAIRASDIRPFSLLPSAIYLPHPSELSPEMYALPWDASLISSASSPGGKAPVFLHVSSSRASHGSPTPALIARPRSSLERAIGCREDIPIEASSRLLLHIRNAWNHAHRTPLETLEVVITVPASFDEVARSLTVTAARLAGFEKFTLVEEPQAAFYDFTARHRRDLAAVLEGVTLVLVRC
jgi:molecular chaperone DnaK (HSP70)